MSLRTVLDVLNPRSHIATPRRPATFRPRLELLDERCLLPGYVQTNPAADQPGQEQKKGSGEFSDKTDRLTRRCSRWGRHPGFSWCAVALAGPAAELVIRPRGIRAAQPKASA